MTFPALFPTYPPFPFQIATGTGDQLVSDDGQRWWDYYGGHCVAATGHAHPRVVAAITAQCQKILFYSTAGQLAIRQHAAEALIAFAKTELATVFFCNSGAEANENALKIARLATGREQVIGVQGGWHGRSIACLSVTDDVKITAPFQSWLLPNKRLAFNDMAALNAMDFSHAAAVIVEPIQSLSGVRACSDEFLLALRARTKASGCALIFDEIQTGVGRTGQPFVGSNPAYAPDIITSAKGLASGVPMAAVMMSEAIASPLKSGDLGSTFGAGPLACAALLATLEVIQGEALMARAFIIEKQIRAICTGLGMRLRGRGALLGIEHHCAAELKSHLYQDHILVGGSSDPSVLRLMPPLNLSDAAINALQYSMAKFQRTST